MVLLLNMKTCDTQKCNSVFSYHHLYCFVYNFEACVSHKIFCILLYNSFGK